MRGDRRVRLNRGWVAISRTPDTPPGALGPLPDGVEIVDVDTGQPCRPAWSANW
ncbi:long-chain-fatty-acid--CoA ligase FadD17 domain protein [Mycobacterium xenopi 3993]|nr:long-chain-fatty-acid--CoA ligase FadD17 domain protein [Mycobacterium xenopi 3993]